LEFTVDMAVVIGVSAVAFLLFLRETLPADMIALLVVVALLLSRVVGPEHALAGFSQPAVHTIAAMFVISAGLVKTGVVESFGRHLIRLGGKNAVVVFLLTLVSVVFLSAFVNNTPIVMMMIPVSLGLSRAHNMPASKLLIPISYASIFGGCCTLLGTSTNLVVSGMGENAGLEPLSMFEMAPVGIILAVVGILYLSLVGQRILPVRETVMSSISEGHIRKYVTELVVQEGSPLIGKDLEATPFKKKNTDLQLLQVIRNEEIFWLPFVGALQPEDILIVRGTATDILAASRASGVSLIPRLEEEKPAADKHSQTLAELVVTPGSRFEGARVQEIGFRQHFNLAVIAIERHGRHREKKISDTRLRVGDVILVQGEAVAINNMREEDGVILLEGVERTVVLRHRAPLAVAIAAGVVICATLSPVPIVACALTGAMLIVLTRCLSIRELYRSIDVHTLVLIAGMIGLGHAAHETRTAAWVAHHAIDVIRPLGPLGVLAAIYLLTNITTEFLSNVASAVLMVPLAISTAQEMGISERPFLIAVAFAASAAFSTPVGYQTNTIVYGPGGYRFTDFTRAGAPLNLIFFLLAMLLIPLFWPLA
jgi:di/tricarboxylate transporter